jgi:hypothetical protein
MWFFSVLIALVCVGCSTDNTTSDSQTEAVKPPPQVRVVTLPSATPSVSSTEESPAAPTIEPTVAPAEVYFWPTPDEDAIVNEIDAMIDEINQKLNSQDLLLKP